MSYALISSLERPTSEWRTVCINFECLKSLGPFWWFLYCWKRRSDISHQIRSCFRLRLHFLSHLDSDDLDNHDGRAILDVCGVWLAAKYRLYRSFLHQGPKTLSSESIYLDIHLWLRWRVGFHAFIELFHRSACLLACEICWLGVSGHGFPVQGVPDDRFHEGNHWRRDWRPQITLGWMKQWRQFSILMVYLSSLLDYMVNSA